MASSAAGSCEKVCEFLESRNIEKSTIRKFMSEKMDVVAVQQASDSDLELLGLTRRGDVLALRSFVEATGSSSDACDERKAKKIKLLQLAKDIKTSKKEGNSNSSILPKPTTINKEKHCSRKVQIGWLHYSSREKRYISVRYNKGGGSREISMNLTANDKDIISKAKELFFPGGKSFHGEAIDMTFSLGRFDCTTIQDKKFYLGKYIEENKLTRVRLYLMSKHDEESDCDSLDVAPFYTNTAVPTELDATPSSSASSCDNAIDGLIGTSTERAKLKQQQNEELQRSLMEDQAKDQQKAAAIDVLKKQQRLQNARLSRVPCIPPPGIPHVLISVRHPTEGVHTRSFCQLETMSAVYDWAGSLALTPESFILSKCTGNVPETLPPELSVTDVDKHLLIMVEDDNMPSYPGNYVDFLGFGQDIPEEDINISWTTPPHIESIPNVLLVDDDLQMVDSSNHSKSAPAGITALETQEQSSDSQVVYSHQVENLQRSTYDGVGNLSSVVEEVNTAQGPGSGRAHGAGNDQTKVIRVLKLRRALILQDLIKEFLYAEILSRQLKIIMVDDRGNEEKGVDSNGVYRDALSNFWQEFYISCSLGEREKVPFLRNDYQSDQWTAVARIVVKGYEDLGYFPVMLSQAFVISVMFGEGAVSEDILLQSFKRYLAPIDEEVICTALAYDKEQLSDNEDLLELLDRFECRSMPTRDNIKSLIMEVAHKEIIQHPQYVADCWEGIFRTTLTRRQFLSVDEVKRLYESLEPTTKKVLAMVDAMPDTNADRSSLEFLKRFIRGMDIAKLKSFVMFVTGADVICVPTIHVNFIKLKGLERRPIAHTCGCVLELPCTYNSYTELCTEFTNILSKGKWQNDIL